MNRPFDHPDLIVMRWSVVALVALALISMVEVLA